MRPSPEASAPTPSTRAPDPSSTELVLGGRAMSKAEVGLAYLLGSAALIMAGVALNWFLTDGRWHTGGSGVQSAFGDGPTYLTSSAYDVTSFAILVVSLVTLGVGFLAAYQPTLHNRWFVSFVGLGGVFAIAWGLQAGHLAEPGDPLLLATLAAFFLLLGLTWFLAAFVGPGPRMHYVRAAGFVLFGFYWATQAMRLYAVEEGDFVNALFAALAVLFFNYFAYHELLSVRRNEDPRALQWLAGAAFITTGVYVLTHKLQVVSEWLIVTVAAQTTWLLQWFGQDVDRGGGVPAGSMIGYPADAGAGSGLYFPIQIILACTAIQSIMIFVGGIAALRPPRRGDGVSGKPLHYEQLRPTYQSRRVFALLLTVPLIYALNLLRNVVVISMSGTAEPWFFYQNEGATEFVCQFSTDPDCNQELATSDPDYDEWYRDRAASASFWFGHNIVGKGGSLFALIVIAFMVFQILPELYDSIVGLLDLKQRRGPLERFFGVREGRRGNGGVRDPTSAPAPPAGEPPPGPLPDRFTTR